MFDKESRTIQFDVDESTGKMTPSDSDAQGTSLSDMLDNQSAQESKSTAFNIKPLEPMKSVSPEDMMRPVVEEPFVAPISPLKMSLHRHPDDPYVDRDAIDEYLNSGDEAPIESEYTSDVMFGDYLIDDAAANEPTEKVVARRSAIYDSMTDDDYVDDAESDVQIDAQEYEDTVGEIEEEIGSLLETLTDVDSEGNVDAGEISATDNHYGIAEETALEDGIASKTASEGLIANEAASKDGIGGDITSDGITADEVNAEAVESQNVFVSFSDDAPIEPGTDTASDYLEEPGEIKLYFDDVSGSADGATASTDDVSDSTGDVSGSIDGTLDYADAANEHADDAADDADDASTRADGRDDSEGGASDSMGGASREDIANSIGDPGTASGDADVVEETAVFLAGEKEESVSELTQLIESNRTTSDTNRTSSGGSKKSVAKEPKYITMKGLVIAVVIAVVVSSLIGAFLGVFIMVDDNEGGGSSKNSQKSLEAATGSKMTIAQIIDENENSVVEITTKIQTMSLFGSTESEGAGSGVIVKENGYIVTNYHVIEGSNSISVRLHNGDDHSAQIVGYDRQNDIAILKIDGKDYDAVTMGSSGDLDVGDLAVAIGNPLGQLGGTATSGIISALDRQLQIDDQTLTLLQTDSAINPGNSGGGLFDCRGQLIGIVVAKSSGTGIEGLGFAIPIDTAKPIIDDIIENGKITNKPAAGIVIAEVTEDRVFEFGVDRPGVYISNVNGENAKNAGLQSGDRIVEFEGKEIGSSSELIREIQTHKIGDKVKFIVERGGQYIEIEFELEDSSKFN